MSLFHIIGLTRVYGHRTVLDISELTLERGRIYGLLGPNGAGKTTLMEILSFLSVPTSGRILYDGQDVTYTEKYLQRLRREVVLAPQHPILFTGSVYRNVEFGLRIRKMPRVQRERIVYEMLDLVGMRSFAQAKAHRLSGGETQRVAIARSLALSPSVLFFDEPTAGVDVENQAAIVKIVKDINEQKGITVVLSSHDQIMASSLAHNVVHLFNGRIAAMLSENVLAGRLETDERGGWLFRVRENLVFRLDPVRVAGSCAKNGREASGDQVKLMIDPRRIQLKCLTAEGDGDKGYPGRIIHMVDQKDEVRLVVDIGLPVSVIQSVADYLEIGFRLRDHVQVHFPPDAFGLL